MTWGVPLLVSYHFAFHTVHGVFKARILKWLAIPFSSGPHSVRPLHHDPPIFGCPAGMAWFIELDKAVVLVWLDWLVFFEYCFSVSALWCPLATPTILLGFLLPSAERSYPASEASGSFSLLSAIRVVSSIYLRFLIFLPAILIPACNSSSPAFLMIYFVYKLKKQKGFSGGAEVKASACNVGDLGSIPGLGRSPGGGNGNPLQYSCLENPMDGGAWWTTVHRLQRVGHDWETWLSFTFPK